MNIVQDLSKKKWTIAVHELLIRRSELVTFVSGLLILAQIRYELVVKNLTECFFELITGNLLNV